MRVLVAVGVNVGVRVVGGVDVGVGVSVGTANAIFVGAISVGVGSSCESRDTHATFKNATPLARQTSASRVVKRSKGLIENLNIRDHGELYPHSRNCQKMKRANLCKRVIIQETPHKEIILYAVFCGFYFFATLAELSSDRVHSVFEKLADARQPLPEMHATNQQITSCRICRKDVENVPGYAVSIFPPRLATVRFASPRTNCPRGRRVAAPNANARE